MPKIVVFSLDYDGCSEILFDTTVYKQFEQCYNYYHAAPRDPGRQPYRENAEQFEKMKNFRKKLNDFLDEKAQDAKEVLVYVGSNRQSIDFDVWNANRNKNGLCFDNLPKLCKDKQWRFCPLLLADTENGKIAGSAIMNKQLTCRFDKTKVETIEGQLLDVKKRFPSLDDNVEFYFLDDDQEQIILPALKNHNEAKANKQALPKNINIHLVACDWYQAVMSNQATLKETACIQNTPVIITAPSAAVPRLGEIVSATAASSPQPSIISSGPTMYGSTSRSSTSVTSPATEEAPTVHNNNGGPGIV